MALRKGVLRVLWIGLGMMVGLTACQRLGQKTEPMPLTGTGEAALHGIESQRLKAIMGELRGLNFDRLPQELDQKGHRAAEVEKASSLALAMAAAAGKIPEAMEGAGLTKEEEEVFRALAERLRTQSLHLSEEVRVGETRAVDATMRVINATCLACHTLFRNAPEL